MSILAVLVALDGGLALRAIGLARTPLPFVDEVIYALDTHLTRLTGRHFDGSTLDAVGWVVPLVDGRFFAERLFGHSITDFRIAPVLFGVVTIGVLSLVARELLDTATGGWSAIALASMPWAIYFSRVDFPASEYVMATALALLFALRALRRQSAVDAALCGVFMLVGIYVYPTAIISMFLMVAVIIGPRWGDLVRLGLRRVAIAVMTSVVVGLPYLYNHLRPTSGLTAGVNSVISSRLIWQQGLPLPDVFRTFQDNWWSFLTPTFLFSAGDPSPRQSVQSLGEVGWVLASLGIVGLITAVVRWRQVGPRTLLLLLLVYPVPDALTYQDARASAVVGATGQLVWAMLAGYGAVALVDLVGPRPRRRGVVAALVLGAIGAQLAVFCASYFGAYASRYGDLFESPSQYESAGAVVSRQDVRNLPLASHSGYLRDKVFEYFNDGRLTVNMWASSCHALPLNRLAGLGHRAVLIVGETTAYDGVSGCQPSDGLIDADVQALRGAGWTVQPLARFFNSPQQKQQTAVLLVERS